LAREENGTDSDSSADRGVEGKEVAAEKGEEKRHGSGTPLMEINMVFAIPTKFRAPEGNVAELVLGEEQAVFEKPKNAGEHMKLLFIRGHMDGRPMGRMMVDGGASVNIMPLTVFKRLGHGEKELKRTNLSSSGFSGESATAHGIVSGAKQCNCVLHCGCKKTVQCAAPARLDPCK
jgi:hypothetical protein